LFLMNILGLSAYYHDSAAVLLKNGKILAAAQEERFTRIKHDSSFPTHAITYCLEETDTPWENLDYIVFYDKPFLKFERILQTFLEEAPRGLPLFLKSMPVWIKEKLFLKSEIRKQLREASGKKLNTPLLFSGHHLSHAASAFYASPYAEAAVLTIDGVGEWATASISYGKGNDLKILQEMHFPDSLGLLYAAFTHFLGFKINEGEYKVMGLAPYADRRSGEVENYLRIIRENIATPHADGSISMNMDYFSFNRGLKMIPVKKWEKLFGMNIRKPEGPPEKPHAALAAALQIFTEDAVIKMAKQAKQITGSDNLCMAGGVALNCVANGKLAEAGVFKSVFVQPAAGDAGGALGAALAVHHLQVGKDRTPDENFIQEGALGPAFSSETCLNTLNKFKLTGKTVPENELFSLVARELADGKVVGWFSGRMEFGPRALGHRSILADAAYPGMQKTLNLKIKKRESFRPFAPIMLEEELSHYFKHAKPNAYMLFVHHFKKEKQFPRPEGFFDMMFSDMLEHAGSELPGVTHVDYSARIQTVSKNSDKKIRALLEEFKRLTGRGILINTSFNVKDEPIVCTPDDAIRCFLQTEMDILVLENILVSKIRE
jgi:carbamoyltransferase